SVESLGHAIPGRAVIQLERQNPRRVIGAQLSSEGKFDFKQVPLGTYNVRIAAQGFYTAKVLVNGVPVSGRAVKIGGNDVTLNVQVSQGVGKITGTVMNGDAPQPAAMVLLVPDNPAQNMTLFRRDQSDSDGTFTLAEVVPGQYKIVAIMDGWNLSYTDPAVM